GAVRRVGSRCAHRRGGTGAFAGLSDGTVARTTLEVVVMYIGEHAKANPGRPAVAMWPSRQEMTYGELYRQSTKLGNLLRSAGLREGDHIAIFAYNHLRYFEVAWAALNTGLYLTPVNAHYTLEEAAYLVDDCGARVLVVS